MPQPLSAAARSLGIGMAVEGANGNFGGGMLRDQVAGETEEERKKRLADQRARAALGPAGTALFGGSPGGLGGM